jgi:hypothetical protein
VYVSSLEVVQKDSFPIASKTLILNRENLFVSDDEKVSVIMYENGEWNHIDSIFPPSNYSNVNDFGRNIIFKDGVLVISCLISGEAHALEYNEIEGVWTFVALIEISADYNLVSFPPTNNRVISMRSSNELVAFTISAGLNAAFIKVFKKNDESGIWEVKNIFSPLVKYSVQNSKGYVCWTESFLFVTFGTGNDKVEVYRLDDLYDEMLFKVYEDQSSSTDEMRYIECFNNYLAVTIPDGESETFKPNNETGYVKIYNPEYMNDGPLYNIHPQDQYQIDKLHFGYGVGMDQEKIIIGSQKNRSVMIYDYNAFGATFQRYLPFSSEISTIPLLVGVSAEVSVVNMLNNTVGNITIFQEDAFTFQPTISPTARPTTNRPTISPTMSPTTESPSKSPTTLAPTMRPTKFPTASPTTLSPTLAPTTKFPKPQEHYSIYIVFSITFACVLAVEFGMYRFIMFRKRYKVGMFKTEKKNKPKVVEEGEDEVLIVR